VASVPRPRPPSPGRWLVACDCRSGCGAVLDGRLVRCDHLVIDLDSITGGLSKPGKMPGPAFGLPATSCKTGSRLRGVTGSVCEQCYAAKGRYFTHRVQKALANRLARLEDPRWVDSMAQLVARRAGSTGFFRWHDSGDLQSVEHLGRIVEVCAKTSNVRHWLPTREYEIVEEYLHGVRDLPANLSIRLSAHMIGGPPPTGLGLPVSTVSAPSGECPPGAYRCPQPARGSHVCGDCRACWDPSVTWVDYLLR
jgi:hypothetical protein